MRRIVAASSPSRRSGSGRRLALVAVLGLGGAAAWWAMKPGAQAVESAPTWKIARGPLRISVTEGGSLQSLKSAVDHLRGRRRPTKIVAIVPEGTSITAEDVANGRILVELDSSEIRNKLNRQEISVSDAAASLAQSRGGLDIQINQNASDVRKADLDVRFARLDLDKYLGAAVAEKALGSRNAEGRRDAPRHPVPRRRRDPRGRGAPGDPAAPERDRPRPTRRSRAPATSWPAPRSCSRRATSRRTSWSPIAWRSSARRWRSTRRRRRSRCS